MKSPVQKVALIASIFLSSAVSSLPGKADQFNIVLDQATVMHLPEKVATIIIGNPSVADGSLQSGGLLVVTGKGFGMTNLIALDNRGNTLAEHILNVSAPKEGRVTVYRGADRETWTCTPKCERSVMLGDTPAYFDAAIAQANTRNGQSAGGTGK